MTKVEKVEGFRKGDVITVIEQHPMWGEFVHKFEIVRNNPKTYGCRYIEGAHKGSGFNWVKGYDLTQSKNREYFI
jgi:hypothetical protein